MRCGRTTCELIRETSVREMDVEWTRHTRSRYQARGVDGLHGGVRLYRSKVGFLNSDLGIAQDVRWDDCGATQRNVSTPRDICLLR